MAEFACSPSLSIWAELGELPGGFCDATVSLEGILAVFVFYMANGSARSRGVPHDRSGIL